MKKSLDIKTILIVGMFCLTFCSFITYFLMSAITAAFMFLSTLNLGLYDEDFSEYQDSRITITIVQSQVEQIKTKINIVPIAPHIYRFRNPARHEPQSEPDLYISENDLDCGGATVSFIPTFGWQCPPSL